MSYTNIEMIRKHLGFENKSGDRQRDLAITFNNVDEIDLGMPGIISGSLILKAAGDNYPVYESAVPNGSEIGLQNNRLIPGSITAASDRSLGTVYVENVDYAVDNDHGRITLLEGGLIPQDEALSVWYFPYMTYTEGVDYAVNYTRGTIRRLNGGMIASGQTLLIDFDSEYRYFSDQIMGRMASEANGIIACEIDPENEFGADPALQAAATYLAASLICRAAAADTLRRSLRHSGDVNSWLSLSESYRKDFEYLVKRFRPGSTRLSPPRNS